MTSENVTMGIYSDNNKEFLKLLRNQTETKLTMLPENTDVANIKTAIEDGSPDNFIYGNWPRNFKWRFKPNSLNVIVSVAAQGLQQQFEFTESYFRKLIVTENSFGVYR